MAVTSNIPAMVAFLLLIECADSFNLLIWLLRDLVAWLILRVSAARTDTNFHKVQLYQKQLSWFTFNCSFLYTGLPSCVLESLCTLQDHSCTCLHFGKSVLVLHCFLKYHFPQTCQVLICFTNFSLQKGVCSYILYSLMKWMKRQ